MTVGVGQSLGGPKPKDTPSEPRISSEADPDSRRGYGRRLEILGVLWVVGAACVALVPTLVHGPYIGPFDFLSQHGLTARSGVYVHNAANGDIEDEVVPWAQLAWTQIHQGHLPLWIRGSGVGMPLAFNFGSAVFSLPALISYIFPIGAILWVQILVSLVVGGTGAYFFGRVLGLHPVACALAGTTWVLSGPFFGYLGLPDTSAMSWAGWQFAAVVLILRGKHRFWSVLLFAVTLALSIYAGNPQIEVLILLPMAVFAVVVLLWRNLVLREEKPVRRPIIDLALASVAGAALSAPLSFLASNWQTPPSGIPDRTASLFQPRRSLESSSRASGGSHWRVVSPTVRGSSRRHGSTSGPSRWHCQWWRLPPVGAVPK